jgi:peptidoglycan hydrolase CwlO-like protein
MRALIGGLVVGIIATIIFWVYIGQYRAHDQEQAQQIAQLNEQITRLQSQNEQLNAEVAKLQAEENNLAAQNDELRKTMASVAVTGKLPPPPPPPPK